MKTSPFIKVIIASVIWGAGGVVIKILNLPSSTLTFYRLFVPAVILFLYLFYKKEKLSGSNMPMLLFASSLNCIRMFLFFAAYNLTSVGNAVIMLYTWPIFTTILSAIFLKEKIYKPQIILLISAFAGIAIIYLNKKFSFQDKDFLGMTIMLASSLIYSFSMIIFKKRSTGLSSIGTTFYQNLVGAFIFIPFAFINPLPVFSIKFIYVILYSVAIGIIGFGLFFSALKETEAKTTSYFSFMEVPSGILFGIIFLHEKIYWNLIVGGIIIIGSVIIMQVLQQKHRSAQ